MPTVEINYDQRTQQQKVKGDKGETFELDGFYVLNEDKTAAYPEGHPDGRFTLGGPGSRIPMADAVKYGLVPAEAESTEEAPTEVGVVEVPEDLKGKLPEDFPGHAALAEAGINTYAQLRKAGDVTEVAGIGPATAKKIAEALAATTEE